MREPTCPVGINFHEMWEASVIPCAACEAIRDAYRRGREDAAQAVQAATYMTNIVPSGWTDETWRGYRPDAIDRDIAIAAARGDGEPDAT